MEMTELQIEMQALLDRGLDVSDAIEVLGKQPIRRNHKELVGFVQRLLKHFEFVVDDDPVILEVDIHDMSEDDLDSCGEFDERLWGHSWVQVWLRVPDYELKCCLAKPQAFSITEEEADRLLAQECAAERGLMMSGVIVETISGSA